MSNPWRTRITSTPKASILRPVVATVLTHPTAGQVAREILDRQVDEISQTIKTDDAQLRVALAMTTILGVTIGRELLGVDALRVTNPQQVIDLMRPSLRALLVEEG